MTGDEHEAQQVVADVVAHGGIHHRIDRLLCGLQCAAELGLLALEERSPAQCVDRPTFRDGHQPGAWVLRYARVRPLLQRGDEGVLREVFGQPDVAHDPGDPGDHPG